MTSLDRKAWLAERKTGLGATDIASLCGVGFGTPQTVWADKTTPEVPDDEPHPLLAIGLATERLNVGLYCRRMGLTYGEDVAKPLPILRHPNQSFAFASLDFETSAGIPVETKYTIFFTDARWGEELTDQVPFGYITQGQWQLGCANRDYQDVSVLSGSGEHRIYRVCRDVKLVGLLLDIGGEFWDRFVTTGTPPPNDWMHPAREELTARLIAIEKERHVVLTGEAEEIAANFVRLKEIAKDADDEAERMKSALNLAMDQHGVPRPGKAIAGDVRLSRWIVEEAYVEPKPYLRKAYEQFRATKIKPKKGK